jgi:hypothetical protein
LNSPEPAEFAGHCLLFRLNFAGKYGKYRGIEAFFSQNPAVFAMDCFGLRSGFVIS